ncbi:c-type cytochrome [Telmatocola sphagniphila]|uniref:C-type cytochrome n=1 Tax=Telmatocola sphagniphila TaxID=1123043 RepID=A0A8E6B7I8_9BACT|nr:cytochrome c [Telmatocola sphagniphila]QVL33555.1 c-type cytochrome [Telmatocola sphagniphila]
MPFLRFFLCLSYLCCCFSAKASPVLVGVSRSHPLSELQLGELLLGELRCLACHTRSQGDLPIERKAPDLKDVGSRISPDYLKKFLLSPGASHSGSLMPNVLNQAPESQRKQIAESLLHFLIAQSTSKWSLQQSQPSDDARGKNLFHTIGCVACHAPREENGKELPVDGAISLGHLTSKYSLNSLTEFLFQPLKIRPAGRMPDMKLTPQEAVWIAGYLLKNTNLAEKPLEPKADLVESGKKYFQQFQCSACHSLEGVVPHALKGDLAKVNLDRGCLDSNTTNSPRFDLEESQLRAIRAALRKPVPASDSAKVALTFTTFNCIACHSRDNFGGISNERNAYFQTSAKNLGEEARIPPPLTLVGAKLQAVWLKKVLFDGESVRPYMLTRMPQFGEAQLRHLPELISKEDRIPSIKFSLPNPESEEEAERKRSEVMRDAGRGLMGDKGLYCISCHYVNGKTISMEGQNGMELMTSTERLQPNWFYQFLKAPGVYRPRIVMPDSWPGGKAAQQTILHGDTDRQIEAIWYYLSLGTSAPNPSGLQTPETKLSVGTATRTYRGRSSVAGYRGIAVGFPEKLHYAFNAETGTLTALWKGDYIRVDRGGQGSGAFNPASRPVQLSQDLSFYKLENEKSPWPMIPLTTREQPISPDPLYPKNRGYQFKGYELDDKDIPTFLYRIDQLEIADRSQVVTGKQATKLERQFIFKSPNHQTIWFRALTGVIEKESQDSFKNGEIRIVIPNCETLVRSLQTPAKTSELLLKFELSEGTTKKSITYELLK